MVGFVFGTVCLVALIATLRRPHGHVLRRCWGGGPRRMLRGLFVRLETSPSQEKEVLRAADEVREAMRSARSELAEARREIAASVGGSSFDEVALDAAFARHDAFVASLRERVRGALSRVHAALDDEQRRELAEILAAGGYRHAFGGPYRGAGH